MTRLWGEERKKEIKLSLDEVPPSHEVVFLELSRCYNGITTNKIVTDPSHLEP